MKVLVAMSGGVDSSVAAALLVREGHEVVGVTLRLWGGASDTGCCSVADVDDARRVAQQLDIDHLVFNFGDEFHEHVVAPYVRAHEAGVTPNPCIECNRHLKFDRLTARAELLGFDAVATGHHARVVRRDGVARLARGADPAKDQSYVVHMLDAAALDRTRFPVGGLHKAEVRRLAAELGLRTAAKPDSQDVCFISSAEGRAGFLGTRTAFTPGRVVDRDGAELARVPAVQLVTIGQRRGLGLPGGGDPQYVVDVDVAAATVTVGDERALATEGERLVSASWPTGLPPAPGTAVLAQCSAHGAPRPALVDVADAQTARLRWAEGPAPRVAPGQTVVLYDPTDEYVVGGGIVTR
jgi:tRNA-specific 2-thiouridylase